MRKKASNFRPKQDLQIGNKYILKDYIDAGTFGSVWTAVNLETDELVALKIPKDQERADNTLAEGKELQGCYHPNIVKLNWMGRVDGVFVIEMEYFKGHKLSDELCETGFRNPKTFEQIYELFNKILDGIEFIHEKKISHGDIKPQNILVTDDVIKITDFGTSKYIENIYVKTIDGQGTMAYMAPEVAGSRKERYINSDIYSLGVLLYQLLTGRTPYETSFQLLEGKTYPRPREINDNIPEEVENIILKALSRNPEERYKNIKEFRSELDNAFNSWGENILTYAKNVEPEIVSDDWLENIMTFYKEKEFKKAELLLENEIEIGNVSQDIIYHLAYVYSKQGRFYDSLNKLKEIDLLKVEDIRRNGFEDNVLYLKGRLYFEVKQYEEARNLYKKLVDNNPENIDYRYKLACIYALNSEEYKAIEILEDINKKTPGLLYIVKKLGHAYDQTRNYSKARAYFNYALRLDPSDEIIRRRVEMYKRYL